jgi:hypothetical protein
LQYHSKIIARPRGIFIPSKENMTDLNTLSDAELEAQVTDQAVIDAS